MKNRFAEGETFEGINFAETGMSHDEFENCVFRRCSFANTDLSNVLFGSCKFETCDLSMATLKNTSFRDVLFKSCKQMGLRFDECNKLLLGFAFESCILNFSSFHKLKLKNTLWKDSTLHEVDFSETELTKSVFQNCDLMRTVFERSHLEGVDFRSAYNFSIDPDANRMKGARFSLEGVAGLLEKYGIIIGDAS